ncbi:MAG: ABC transporter ATP-binding protein [Planctomycetes bacterium]|nr:ABC transporter ATP-binding protein [Planctomycetota bacterium]
MAKTMVITEKVTKVFHRGNQEIRPLHQADVVLPEGELLCLMGPSGSGKTTLLNLMAGIDRPTEGRIIVDGTEISKLRDAELSRWRTRSIGYIFQLYNLVPVLTAWENVELPLLLLPLSKAERRKHVETALKAAGILERKDHYPRQLSGGQEQRVAIARAIVTDPKVLLADEPTGDLDAVSKVEILDLLKSLNQQHGKTMVMVTHDPGVAEYADRTVHLDKGVLREAHESTSPRA